MSDFAELLRRAVRCGQCDMPVDKVRLESDAVLLRQRFVITCHGEIEFFNFKDPRFMTLMASRGGKVEVGAVTAFELNLNDINTHIARTGAEPFKSGQPVVWFKSSNKYKGKILTEAVFEKVTGNRRAYAQIIVDGSRRIVPISSIEAKQT